MKLLIGGYDYLVIDEAQRIPDIGINLKIIHDNIPDSKIIATGSSSFELANRIKESLTGRRWTFVLYPISLLELNKEYSVFEMNSVLNEVLICGRYPEIFSFSGNRDKYAYLRELSR